MGVYLKQIKGISFAAKGDSNHWVVMDGSEEFGGHNAGTRPMEMVLLSLAGCTGADVVSILKKRRVNLHDLEITVDSKRADTHPKVYTKIHLHFIFHGKDLNPKDLEMAINLSQNKYCSVTAMLEKTADITHDYEIVDV
ncbi:MAG: OsmC family protein [Calditrichaeota bacterium]|nr:OsmC family protein [Calditrichota bacterium]